MPRGSNPREQSKHIAILGAEVRIFNLHRVPISRLQRNRFQSVGRHPTEAPWGGRPVPGVSRMTVHQRHHPGRSHSRHPAGISAVICALEPTFDSERRALIVPRHRDWYRYRWAGEQGSDGRCRGVAWRVTQAAQQRVMSQGDDVQITIEPEVTFFTIPSHTAASFVPAV